MSGCTPALVYFSSKSGNTHRFVSRLRRDAIRLPADPVDVFPVLSTPFVLVCPTYADGEGRGAVPKQVIRFLNAPERRSALVGVIGTGNRNFGATYALAGRIIAEKCDVPLLYTLELAGTEIDVAQVSFGLEILGKNLCSTVP